ALRQAGPARRAEGLGMERHASHAGAGAAGDARLAPAATVAAELQRRRDEPVRTLPQRRRSAAVRGGETGQARQSRRQLPAARAAAGVAAERSRRRRTAGARRRHAGRRRKNAPLRRYDQLRLNAELSPASQRIDVHGGLDDGGHLDGQITISGAQQTLGGQLDLRLNNLAFIELLSSEVANVKGGADGNFRFAGTLKQPAITGQANVHEFAAEVPSAGLKLSQGRLGVSTSDARQFL